MCTNIAKTFLTCAVWWRPPSTIYKIYLERYIIYIPNISTNTSRLNFSIPWQTLMTPLYLLFQFMVMNVPTTTPNNNGRVSTVTTPPPLMPVAPGAQTPRRPSPSPITLGPRPPCTTTSVSESDRNNNATPPSNRSSLSLPPPPPVIPNARRAAIQPRSPPVGARQKDLPPGAAPIGSIAMPPRPPIPSTSSQAMSVPLLACQLGRPVNLGERGPPGPLAGGPRPLGGIPPVSPHHISNLLSHTLFAAIPTGNGRIMARNINGTRKFAFWSMSCT